MNPFGPDLLVSLQVEGRLEGKDGRVDGREGRFCLKICNIILYVFICLRGQALCVSPMSDIITNYTIILNLFFFQIQGFKVNNISPPSPPIKKIIATSTRIKIFFLCFLTPVYTTL